VHANHIQLTPAARDFGDPGRDVLVQVELHVRGSGRMNG
jgi:hypothetical protein